MKEEMKVARLSIRTRLLALAVENLFKANTVFATNVVRMLSNALTVEILTMRSQMVSSVMNVETLVLSN
jgi:hypothetical protein